MSAPKYLRERGRAIWDAFAADGLPAAHQAMIHEAGRLADALDKLDAILGGRQDDWVKIMIDDMGEVTLEVDGLLGERRLYAMAFKTMMQEIRQAGLTQTPIDKPKTGEDEEDRGAIILNLRDRVG